MLDVFGRMLSEITRGMIVTQNEGDSMTPGRYATIVQHPQGQIITGRIIEETRTMYVQQSGGCASGAPRTERLRGVDAGYHCQEVG